MRSWHKCETTGGNADYVNFLDQINRAIEEIHLQHQIQVAAGLHPSP